MTNNSIWTPENLILLTEMWKAGKSAREIGARLGYSHNAVLGRKHRLGLSQRGNSTPWMPDEDATLIDLRRINRSYSQIGAAIGRTKNSVISRANRLRTEGRLEWTAEIVHTPKAYQMPSRLTVARSIHPRKANVAGPRKRHELPPCPSGTVPVDLLACTGCKWPVTAVSPHLFCNAPRCSFRYCDYHENLSINPLLRRSR